MRSLSVAVVAIALLGASVPSFAQASNPELQESGLSELLNDMAIQAGAAGAGLWGALSSETKAMPGAHVESVPKDLTKAHIAALATICSMANALFQKKISHEIKQNNLPDGVGGEIIKGGTAGIIVGLCAGVAGAEMLPAAVYATLSQGVESVADFCSAQVNDPWAALGTRTAISIIGSTGAGYAAVVTLPTLVGGTALAGAPLFVALSTNAVIVATTTVVAGLPSILKDRESKPSASAEKPAVGQKTLKLDMGDPQSPLPTCPTTAPPAPKPENIPSVTSCAQGKEQIEAARRSGDKTRLVSLIATVSAICARENPVPVTVVTSCADGKAQIERARRDNDQARLTSLIATVPLLCEQETPQPPQISSCEDGKAQLQAARRGSDNKKLAMLIDAVPELCASEAEKVSNDRDETCVRDHGPGYVVGHVLPDGRFFCKPSKPVADAWCTNKNGKGHYATNIDDRGGFACMPTKASANARCNRINPGSGWYAVNIKADGSFGCRKPGVVRRKPTYRPRGPDPTAAIIGGIIQGIINNRTSGGGRGGGGGPQRRCHRNPYTGQVHCGSN